MSNTVVGIFEYTSEAQEAQKYLLANGFSSENVDIKISGTSGISHASGDVDKDEDTVDRIGSFFKNLFGDDDEEADRYTEAGRKGTILTVHARTADEAEAAARILDNYGAVDVNESAGGLVSSSDSYISKSEDSNVYGTERAYTNPETEFDPSDSTGTESAYTNPVTEYDSSYVVPVTGSTPSFVDPSYAEPGYAEPAYAEPVSDSDTDSIKVIQEELTVGKREVQTGGVRLKSRIIERPVEESIRLREEYVTVERTPVDRVATEADFDAFKEETIEVIEHAEVPVVSKEARIVEEISLRKEVEEREETIKDTVRSTEVETEELTSEEGLRKTGYDI